MQLQDDQIFQLHADFCRMLGHPKRLKIMALVNEGRMSVGEIAEAIDTPLPTVSQHLRILRNRHMVVAQKEGQTVFYRTSDPRILEACTLMRQVLVDGLRERGDLARRVEEAETAQRDDDG